MQFDVLHLNVIYLIFTDGTTWCVQRFADGMQQLAGDLSTKDQALKLAFADSQHWPGCSRQVFSFSRDGVKTLEAEHYPD